MNWHLPQDILITTQMRSGKSYTVNGATRLYLGDSIFVVVKESEIGRGQGYSFVKDRFSEKFFYY